MELEVHSTTATSISAAKAASSFNIYTHDKPMGKWNTGDEEQQAPKRST